MLKNSWIVLLTEYELVAAEVNLEQMGMALGETFPVSSMADVSMAMKKYLAA